MDGLAPYILSVLVFAAVACLVAGTVLGWSHRSNVRKLNLRLMYLTESPETSKIIRLAILDDPTAAGYEWLVRKFPRTKALARLCVRAGARLTAPELLRWMVLCAGGAFILAFLLLSANIMLALLAAFVFGMLPIQYLKIIAEKRSKEFEGQLPEALDFISRALRAGHGLTASLGMVAEELKNPIAEEFKSTFDEISFGLAFPQAMTNLVDRVRSADLSFLVIALLIQRETGGNLTELLTSLAKTVRDRSKLKGRIRVLSAEGKYSAILLGALPFLLGFALTLVNPEYMGLLWFNETGQKLVSAGLAMVGLGFFWIRQLVRIEV